MEAKQYKRPDMNGGLGLDFASDDFARTKWKNLMGTTRWSDGTEMVTLDYSHLPACCGGCARASRPGWTHLKPGRGSGGRRTSKKTVRASSFLGQQVGVFRPPRSRGALISSFLGQQAQASLHPRNLEQAPFWVINGGAEGPGRRLQREGPAEAVPTRTAARP